MEPTTSQNTSNPQSTDFIENSIKDRLKIRNWMQLKTIQQIHKSDERTQKNGQTLLNWALEHLGSSKQVDEDMPDTDDITILGDVTIGDKPQQTQTSAPQPQSQPEQPPQQYQASTKKEGWSTGQVAGLLATLAATGLAGAGMGSYFLRPSVTVNQQPPAATGSFQDTDTRYDLYLSDPDWEQSSE